ncbi:MAG: hypothetical protein J1E83_07235 [Lachnospiraceae bacterium]|nr:hypothetical protein [Lachnospiraceae bacterium]
MKNTLNTLQKPKKTKKCVNLLTVILSLILLLSGCIPDNFSPEEERAFLEIARGVVSNFLDNEYSGAKIEHIQVETDVAPDGSGYELTEFASGQFSWQGQTYSFLVNTETEAVYTSVYLPEITEGLKEALLQGFAIDASEADVDDLKIYYLPINDRSTGRDLDIRAVRNVFPLRASAEELLREILQDTEDYTVFIEIQYKGEDFPSGITEQDAPFPALLSATFYHIGEEHGLCQAGREGFSYSIMPSLSEEILRIKYSQSSPSDYSYIRNQVLEQDGFCLLYNAYERTMEEDVVTEYVITEEDITFTVTEEYIAIDCTQDNYVMYLSATDKKEAEKYCYAFDRGAHKKVEIEEGMWFAYEDRYVYADNIYVKAPHKFYDYDSVGNIIYTKSASKKPPILPQSTEFEYIY